MPSLIRAPGLPRALIRVHSRHVNTSAYDSTIKNLNLGREARVIYQGFTGKAATVNAIQGLEFGTNVVGGTTPGKSGTHLGLPLYPTVAEAAQHLKPHATSIFVPAEHAASAIESAIAAEIPLIVAVAEHLPLHSILRIHSMLRTQSASRLVGANCPGLINPRTRCRIGFMPHPSFLPGTIGIVAKSGTLSYEAVASTTAVGLGQSAVIGMGGDAIAGTSLVDAVKLFLEDRETEGVVVIGEVGGDAEMEVAEVVTDYRRAGGRKPVMALVAGHCALEGHTMGHAGAMRGIYEPSVSEKTAALERAGVTMVQHPGQFGAGMMRLLNRPLPKHPFKGMGPRGFHTAASGKRSYFTTVPVQAAEVLEHHAPGIRTTFIPPTAPTTSLAIALDRSLRSPSLLVTSAGSTGPTRIPFDYISGPPATLFPALVDEMWKLYKSREAYTLLFRHVSADSTVHLHSEDSVILHLDPAREQHGIVYKRLPGLGTVGTVVNGAGLAMNTADVLGERAANFLDTGGKATVETVVESLRTVLEDARVKAVFVNIFGGLTDCGMIAQGILTAYKVLDLAGRGIPVVVRLRGTNEEAGQGMIIDSGLPVWAFPDLEEAVAKVVELAK